MIIALRKALGSIDDADYDSTFAVAAHKKLQLLKGEKNMFIKKRKLRDHLLQRGYEARLIHEWLQKI